MKGSYDEIVRKLMDICRPTDNQGLVDEVGAGDEDGEQSTNSNDLNSGTEQICGTNYTGDVEYDAPIGPGRRLGSLSSLYDTIKIQHYSNPPVPRPENKMGMINKSQNTSLNNSNMLIEGGNRCVAGGMNTQGRMTPGSQTSRTDHIPTYTDSTGSSTDEGDQGIIQEHNRTESFGGIREHTEPSMVQQLQQVLNREAVPAFHSSEIVGGYSSGNKGNQGGDDDGSSVNSIRTRGDGSLTKSSGIAVRDSISEILAEGRHASAEIHKTSSAKEGIRAEFGELKGLDIGHISQRKTVSDVLDSDGSSDRRTSGDAMEVTSSDTKAKLKTAESASSRQQYLDIEADELGVFDIIGADIGTERQGSNIPTGANRVSFSIKDKQLQQDQSQQRANDIHEGYTKTVRGVEASGAQHHPEDSQGTTSSTTTQSHTSSSPPSPSPNARDMAQQLDRSNDSIRPKPPGLLITQSRNGQTQPQQTNQRISRNVTLAVRKICFGDSLQRIPDFRTFDDATRQKITELAKNSLVEIVCAQDETTGLFVNQLSWVTENSGSFGGNEVVMLQFKSTSTLAPRRVISVESLRGSQYGTEFDAISALPKYKQVAARIRGSGPSTSAATATTTMEQRRDNQQKNQMREDADGSIGVSQSPNETKSLVWMNRQIDMILDARYNLLLREMQRSRGILDPTYQSSSMADGSMTSYTKFPDFLLNHTSAKFGLAPLASSFLSSLSKAVEVHSPISTLARLFSKFIREERVDPSRPLAVVKSDHIILVLLLRAVLLPLASLQRMPMSIVLDHTVATARPPLTDEGRIDFSALGIKRSVINGTESIVALKRPTRFIESKIVDSVTAIPEILQVLQSVFSGAALKLALGACLCTPGVWSGKTLKFNPNTSVRKMVEHFHCDGRRFGDLNRILEAVLDGMVVSGELIRADRGAGHAQGNNSSVEDNGGGNSYNGDDEDEYSYEYEEEGSGDGDGADVNGLDDERYRRVRFVEDNKEQKRGDGRGGGSGGSGGVGLDNNRGGRNIQTVGGGNNVYMDDVDDGDDDDEYTYEYEEFDDQQPGTHFSS